MRAPRAPQDHPPVPALQNRVEETHGDVVDHDGVLFHAADPEDVALERQSLQHATLETNLNDRRVHWSIHP